MTIFEPKARSCAAISLVMPSSCAAPVWPLRIMAPDSRTGTAACGKVSNLLSLVFIHSKEACFSIVAHCASVGAVPRKSEIRRRTFAPPRLMSA